MKRLMLSAVVWDLITFLGALVLTSLLMAIVVKMGVSLPNLKELTGDAMGSIQEFLEHG